MKSKLEYNCCELKTWTLCSFYIFVFGDFNSMIVHREPITLAWMNMLQHHRQHHENGMDSSISVDVKLDTAHSVGTPHFKSCRNFANSGETPDFNYFYHIPTKLGPKMQQLLFNNSSFRSDPSHQ
ncbi:unnamed protein product [Ambrosiozyma monospora]|uniref:Unnamed protein product n=1 Tax=Ambrosiozyma monospora TaxID=43982 RepID=A0ACB5T7T9_AMBMO|nr:unnamed protein product [Ambrosiozyma monospora]